MNIRRQIEGLAIWLVASLVFGGAIMLALVIIDSFGPSGDAAFGFGLCLIPSFIAIILGYFGMSIWMAVSGDRKLSIFSQRLKFSCLYFFIAGGLLGGVLIVNAVVVHQNLSHRT